jgi:predicted RNA-binding Zn-ribbon protein involved in translation (DUF1610 family)
LVVTTDAVADEHRCDMTTSTTITWVLAEARFDNVSFSNVIVDGRSLPPTTTYTCPRCEQHVGFTRQNFEHAWLRRSIVPLPLAALLDTAAASRGHESLGFVDWACPGCGLVVRAYANAWAGGMHGDSGVDIVEVAEMAQS